MLITTYYGVFPTGMIVEKPTLKELNQVPGVQYFFKYQDNREQMNNWSLYTLVNVDGTQDILRVGNFELIDIAKESLSGRFITYKDIRSDVMRQIRSTTYGYQLLIKDALPLMNKLNEIGSFEMYDKLIELEELKKENDKLKKEVQTLTKQLELLDTNS